MNTSLKTPVKSSSAKPSAAEIPKPGPTPPPAPPNPQPYLDYINTLAPSLNELSSKIDTLKRNFSGILLASDGLAKSNLPLSPADQPAIAHLADSIRSFAQQVASLQVPVPPPAPRPSA